MVASSEGTKKKDSYNYSSGLISLETSIEKNQTP